MVEPEQYVGAGLWHTADTLPELAAKIGVDADHLVQTVKRYNEFVAAGVDDELHRCWHTPHPRPALQAMTHALALEFAMERVRFPSVQPGSISSGMTDGTGESKQGIGPGLPTSARSLRCCR